jgi:hypothetical protein
MGLILAAAAVVAGALFTVRAAVAVPPFLAQFKAMYVKANAKERDLLIFKEAVEAKKCGICHHGTPAQKKFNAYGQEVHKLLSKADGNNTNKIRAALSKVARIKSKADDASSPTFGDRLRQGKLPVGEIHVQSKEDGN